MCDAIRRRIVARIERIERLTNRLTRLLSAAAIVSVVLVAIGCVNRDNDKAGGSATTEPRVITMAQSNRGAPTPQLTRWAEDVRRRSAGALRIEFEDGWRFGEAKYEAGTIEDVKAGKVDMAYVGARVFDTVGVKSFQALSAPMLVDSYELQEAVFNAGIPDQMLAGLDKIDLVGIGVLPGPMFKTLGVSKPFVRPSDFAGTVIGIQDSALAEQIVLALGATPHAVPTSAELNGLDGYEQPLPSIVGNHYEATAGFVTANVNMWPRPLVIVMSDQASESLTPAERRVLREAARAAQSDALNVSRSEDDDAVAYLCQKGMTLTVASEQDLADLNAAFEPLYQQLVANSETESYIDTIRALKETVGTAPEAPECPIAKHAEDTEAFPQGTYEMTLALSDWPDSCLAEVGVAKNSIPDTTLHRATFNAGSYEVLVDVDGTMQPGDNGTYTVFRDRISFTSAGTTGNARWSFDGKNLTFSDLTGWACDAVVVMTTHAWARTP